VMIDSPGIAPFHAMLDHRQRPYRLIPLSQEGGITLRGQSLAAHETREVNAWDIIEIDGYKLMVLDGVEPAGSQPTTTDPAPPEPSSPPPIAMPAAVAGAGVGQSEATSAAVGLSPVHRGGRLALRPTDETDEAILAELPEREWIINVEQTIMLQLTVINGGDIVAAFHIHVDGIDPEWVTIVPPQVNLYEGERATIAISITPPRLPSSRAGTHHFAVEISSPNYAGRRCRLGATLTLNPYYEFVVGDLSPRQQTVGYFRQTGHSTLPIENRGNSEAQFSLEGSDDARACSFEFQVPGETTSLVAQADMHLSPEEMATIPIRITPRTRQLIGLRRRSYAFTVTTALREAGQAPRMVLGQLKSSPLIGFWTILLVMLLFAAGIIFLFIPGTEPRLYSEQGQRVSATNNQLTLSYNASRFKRWGPDNILNRLNGLALDIKIEKKLSGAADNTYEVVQAALKGPDGAVNDNPQQDVVYRMTVDNWMSVLLPRLSRTASYQVAVLPILPEVSMSPKETNIETGAPISLSWEVEYADRLVLRTQAGLVIETFEKPEPEGSYQVTPDGDTVYIMEAYNLYTGNTPETAASIVKVVIPPPPTPDIAFFMAQPAVIVEGTPVVLSWRVTGADSVSLESDDPADRPIEVGPDGPSISRQPTRNTLFTLKAIKGQSTVVARQEVGVTPAPTPTGTPAPPEIVYFTAEPVKIVRSDENLVTLKWSVEGKTTNVEISGPTLSSPITNLQAEDAISVSVDSTALFILAAFNQDQKASQNVQVEVEEPTPTPSPPPPPTSTPVPAIVKTFAISSPGSPAVVDKGGTNPRQYEVQDSTSVVFTWQVDDATSVTFTPAGGSSQEVGATGQTNVTISGAGIKNYSLVGENDVGEATQTYVIEVTVVDKPAPNPPYDVMGTEDVDTKNTITWRWTYDSNNADIIGFRVYRATVPGGTFSVIPEADEYTLPRKEGTSTYADEVSPTCGRAYYVVAVYEDINGSVKESVVSTNSWYSLTCVAP